MISKEEILSMLRKIAKNDARVVRDLRKLIADNMVRVKLVEDVAIETADLNIMSDLTYFIKEVDCERISNAALNTPKKTYDSLIKYCNFISTRPGFPMDKFVETFIKSRRALLMADFANRVEGAPVKKMVMAIINCDDPEKYLALTAIFAHITNQMNYDLDKDIDKDGIRPLITDTVMSSNDYHGIHAFSRVDDAPIEQITAYFINLDSPPDMFDVARNFVKNVEKIAIMLKIDVENFKKYSKDDKEELKKISNKKKYLLLKRKQVNKEIKKLGKAVAKTHDGEWIYNFAKEIPNAPLEDLRKGMAESTNGEFIFKFIMEFENLDKSSLFISLAKYGTAQQIYEAATKYKEEAPILEFAKAMMKTPDGEYIYKFLRDFKDFPGISILEFANSMLTTKNCNYICKFLYRFWKTPDFPILKFFDAIFSFGEKEYSMDVLLDDRYICPYVVQKFSECVKNNIFGLTIDDIFKILKAIGKINYENPEDNLILKDFILFLLEFVTMCRFSKQSLNSLKKFITDSECLGVIDEAIRQWEVREKEYEESMQYLKSFH